MVPITLAIRDGAGRLAAAGIADARREARLLLAHALSLPPSQLLAQPDALVPTGLFDALVARRAAREPLALITGHQEFWSLDFAVSSATLIPRADSETLIDAALAALPERTKVGRILDLGTGSGCLLLAALREFPAAFGVGVDRMADAVALADRNAMALGLAPRTAFMCGDWATALAGRFDLILGNPPYIPTDEIARLAPEVAMHEPASALSGGADGLEAYRAIMPVLPPLMKEGGVAILEVGLGQAASVLELGEAAGLAGSCSSDLAGIERAIVLRRRQAGSARNPVP